MGSYWVDLEELWCQRKPDGRIISSEGEGASTNPQQDSEAPAPEKKHQGRRWQVLEELGKMTKPDKATIKIHAVKINLI